MVNFGFRKITISTAGLLPPLEELLKQFPNLGIAISLNAVKDKVRDLLMPINRKYSIDEIFNFLKRKKRLFKRRVTLEYVLINEVNDFEADAEELVRLTNQISCKINLIPFNPFPGCDFKRPSDQRIEKFKEILMQGKNAVTFRESAGSKIYAACGQLANLEKQEVD